MKNKFSIFDLFFKTKRKKEKIREQEKKEKEQIIINNQNNNCFENEYFVDPFITPISFFNEKDKKQTNTKKEKDNIAKQKEELYCADHFVEPVSIANDKNNSKDNNFKVLDGNKTIIKVQKQKDKTDEVDTKNIISIKNSLIQEIEKNIKEDFYQLSKIKYELETIKKEEEKELEKEKLEELIEQLNDLIKKFENLKKEFYQKNYDKIDNIDLNDKYINELMQAYKTALKTNNVVIDSFINIEQIEEYIDIITSLIYVEDASDKLNNSLQDKKDDFNNLDKAIEEYEQNYTDIDKVNNYIESFTRKQDSIIKNIEKLVEESTSITKKAEYDTKIITNYSKLLSATLLMATSSIIPPTKAGNMLKLGLIVAAVANMSKVMHVSTKEKSVTTTITNIDYSSSIQSGINDINNIDNMISNSLTDIKYMKQSFKRDFEEYKNVIPEYASMLAKLDSIEQELIIKQKLAKSYENKLNKVLNKNNVKVKRLDEEYKH